MEDERLIEKETEDLIERTQTMLKRCRRLQQWVALLGVVASLSVLALLLGILALSGRYESFNGALSPVPHIPWTSVTFYRDYRYAAPSTANSDQAWGSMMPPGDGFILLPGSTYETYGLPLGKHTDEGQVYDISLFHQLHCLTNIRNHLFTLEFALPRNNSQEIFDVLLKPQADHVYHCLDYIRQAIMCAGDMTLEWPRTEADGSRVAVDGWNITHQCRSWDAIMDFMEQYTVANAFR